MLNFEYCNIRHCQRISIQLSFLPDYLYRDVIFQTWISFLYIHVQPCLSRTPRLIEYIHPFVTLSSVEVRITCRINLCYSSFHIERYWRSFRKVSLCCAWWPQNNRLCIMPFHRKYLTTIQSSKVSFVHFKRSVRIHDKLSHNRRCHSCRRCAQVRDSEPPSILSSHIVPQQC